MNLPRLDLSSLSLFTLVVRTGSISQGAALAHLAIGAASRRITDLEAAVGVTLLERHSRGVRPTAAGRVFYGGGGITPDVKIPPFKPNHFEDTLLIKYALFNFAQHYLNGRHVDKNFEVTDAVMQDFRKFLDEQKVPYTEAELQEGQDWIKANIKAEIFISEFGQEEGLKVRAQTDPQVLAALNDLPKAKELADNARKVMAQRAAASASR